MIFINRLKSTYNYGGPGLGDLIAGYGHVSGNFFKGTVLNI